MTLDDIASQVEALEAENKRLWAVLDTYKSDDIYEVSRMAAVMMAGVFATSQGWKPKDAIELARDILAEARRQCAAERER